MHEIISEFKVYMMITYLYFCHFGKNGGRKLVLQRQQKPVEAMEKPPFSKNHQAFIVDKLSKLKSQALYLITHCMDQVLLGVTSG